MKIKAPKRGRFHGDPHGAIEYNVTNGRARIRWSVWYEHRDEPGWLDSWSRVLGATVALGRDDRGLRLYPEEGFRNLKRALRRYHNVMANADLIALDVAEHQRAEVEDWRPVEVRR